jgi:Effector-associated domain 11
MNAVIKNKKIKMGKINLLVARFRSKIAEGNVDIVLRDLDRLGRDSKMSNDIILVKSRLSNINYEKKEGIMSAEDYRVELTKITKATIALLDEIANNEGIITIFHYEDTQYIVGLDFGDGESAISYTKISDTEPPQMVEFESEEKSLISALLREGDRFLIGASAVVNSPDSKELEVNFKKPPSSHEWKMAKRNISDFVDTLFNDLYNKNLNINSKNTILYIGHPSSWQEEEVKTYRDTFKKNESLPNLEVVSESRSALINARDFSDIPKEKLKKNVLLIDLGSSTTDFTFLKNGKPTELPKGKDFGCNLMDFLIKQWAVDNHPQKEYWAERLHGKYGRSFRQNSYLTLLCRLYKEKVFGSHVQILKPIDLDFIEVFEHFYSLMNDKLDIQTIKKLKFNENTHPKFAHLTWEQSFENLLSEVKISLKEEISAILVTGGGSRMNFVKDSCIKKFGVHEKNLFAGKMPSYAIAMGLAGYGKWKYRLNKFHKEVDDLCDVLLEERIKENAPAFLNKLMKIIFPLGYEKFIKPRLVKFINGEINMDVLGGDLLKYAGKEVADWLNNNTIEGQKYKDELSKEFLDSVVTELNKEANQICRAYNIPEGSLAVNFVIPANLFENVLADFVSKIVTFIANATIGNLSVDMRKKLFSWVLTQEVDQIITLAYSTGIHGSIAFSGFFENLAQRVLRLSTNEMNDITVKMNPFLQTAIKLLKSEFSMAIHNKAEEVELFII